MISVSTGARPLAGQIAASLAVALCLPTGALAATQIVPSITIQTGSTDSVRLSSTDQEGAVITTGTAGLVARTVTETTEVRGSASVSYTDYAGADDSVKDIDSQQASALLRRTLPSISYGVVASFRRDGLLRLERASQIPNAADVQEPEPIDFAAVDEGDATGFADGDIGGEDEIDAVGSQIRRRFLQSSEYVQFRLNDRNRLRVSHSYAQRSFETQAEQRGLRESDRHTIAAELSHDVDERDSLSVNLSASELNPQQFATDTFNQFARYYQATVGWKARVTPVSRLTARVGISYVDSERNNDTGFVFMLQGRRQMPRGNLSAQLRRAVQPTAFGQVAATDQLILGLSRKYSQRLSSSTQARGLRRNKTRSDDDLQRSQFNFSHVFEYKLARAWSARLGYEYRWVDRESSVAEDQGKSDSHTGYVGIAYRPVIGGAN
ncbi:MAG: hypothetical protein AAF515_18635 [Pseudomonadota bacterium]